MHSEQKNEKNGVAEAGPSPASNKESVCPDDSLHPDRPREVGGPKGPEPTRYGDWERKGRCVDF